MTDFSVGDNGLMVESSIHELAAWYSRFPDAGNSLNYEAHVMLMRAYVSLVAVTSGSGVPRARYNVLRILYQQPDRRLQMTDIGVGLNVSLTNVTKLVDGLESDGLVRRVPHEDDKRRTWTELTDAGAREFEAVLPAVLEYTDSIWDQFTDDEKRVLIHGLAKLRMVLLAREAGQELAEFSPTKKMRRGRRSFT